MTTQPACATANLHRTLSPLQRLLRELAAAVEAFTDQQYNSPPEDGVGGTIGGHVRHVLDHYRVLLEGVRVGRVNYDDRQRGTDVEQRRFTALQEIARRQRELAELGTYRQPDDPISVQALVAPDANPVILASTVERELVYVLSHSVHHHAIIALAAARWSVRLPRYFGYAPATIQHLEQQSCAPSPS